MINEKKLLVIFILCILVCSAISGCVSPINGRALDTINHELQPGEVINQTTSVIGVGLYGSIKAIDLPEKDETHYEIHVSTCYRDDFTQVGWRYSENKSVTDRFGTTFSIQETDGIMLGQTDNLQVVNATFYVPKGAIHPKIVLANSYGQIATINMTVKVIP